MNEKAEKRKRITDEREEHTTVPINECWQIFECLFNEKERVNVYVHIKTQTVSLNSNMQTRQNIYSQCSVFRYRSILVDHMCVCDTLWMNAHLVRVKREKQKKKTLRENCRYYTPWMMHKHKMNRKSVHPSFNNTNNVID